MKKIATGAVDGLLEGVGTCGFLTGGHWLVIRYDLPGWASFWLSLAPFIAVLAARTGAHLNPAVTVGMVVGKRFPVPMAVWYVLTQVVGGCGSVVLLVLLQHKTFSQAAAQALIVKPAPGVSEWRAALGEALVFFLVIFALAWGSSDKKWVPLLIAGGLALAIKLQGDVTGGSFNPANALAPYIVGRSTDGLIYALIAYMGGPVVGGVAAGVLYRTIRKAPA